jgi:hypothetical protein
VCRIGTILCGAALIATTTAAIGGTVQTPQEPPKKNVVQQPLVVPHMQQPVIRPQQAIQQPVVSNHGQTGQVAAPIHAQPSATQVPTFSPSFQAGGQTTSATGSHPTVGPVAPAVPGRLNFVPVGQVQSTQMAPQHVVVPGSSTNTKSNSPTSERITTQTAPLQTSQPALKPVNVTTSLPNKNTLSAVTSAQTPSPQTILQSGVNQNTQTSWQPHPAPGLLPLSALALATSLVPAI